MLSFEMYTLAGGVSYREDAHGSHQNGNWILVGKKSNQITNKKN